MPQSTTSTADARPTGLRTRTNAVQWTNGQRLITGSIIMGLFGTVFAILSGVGTWASGTAMPNLVAALIASTLGVHPTAHVPNAAALAILHSHGESVVRDDVGATYVDTGSNCTRPDGGWQIQIAPGHCMQTLIANGASVMLWGAQADDTTDLSPFLARAAAAMNAIGGGEITIPSTPVAFAMKSTFRQTYSNVRIRCQTGAVLDRQFAAGNTIQIGNPTYGLASGGAVAQNTGISDCTFKHSTIATSGADVELSGNRNTYANNIRVLKGAFQGVALDNGVLFEVANYQQSAEGQTGIAIGCNGSLPPDITIRGGNINYQHRTAIEACNASGVDIIGGLNTDFNTHALWAHPGAGQEASAIRTDGAFFDASFQEGVLLDATGGGTINENMFSPDTWIATCGATVAPPRSNMVTGDAFATSFRTRPSAPCFSIKGSLTATGGAGSVIHNVFKAFVFNAAGEGVVADGGLWNDYGGVSTDNCLAYAPRDGLCSGFKAKAGTSHFTWDGRLGGRTGTRRPNSDAYGAVIETGASNYYSIRGDLSGNVTGPLFDGGTGTIKSFVGMIPPFTRGIAKLPLGTSPYTYTAGYSRESISLFGGKVSSVTIGTQQVCAASPCSFVLEPNQPMTITYSAAPTVVSNGD